MPPAHEVLRDYRVKCNMTQQQAADAVYVSLSTLRRWERGEYFPDGDDLERLCAAYGVSEETLLRECAPQPEETPQPEEALQPEETPPEPEITDPQSEQPPKRNAALWIGALAVLLTIALLGAWICLFHPDRQDVPEQTLLIGQLPQEKVIILDSGQIPLHTIGPNEKGGTSSQLSCTLDPGTFSSVGGWIFLGKDKTVQFDCIYTPAQSAAIGLIDLKGNFYYLNCTDGSMRGSIQIETTGSYLIAVRNNGCYELTVTGTIDH